MSLHSKTLQNKIQGSLLVTVAHSNPNGDPLNGNRPRQNAAGYGYITAECIKRKVRNRLQGAGLPIYVQSEGRTDDGCRTLKERLAASGIMAARSNDEKAELACGKWLDVRAFGQVFAFKGDRDDASGDSIGIRGPVSVQDAYSIDPVEVESIQITKSCSSDLKEGEQRSSDTMGMKHQVKFGLYRVNFTMNPQLADRTGFSGEDAETVIEAFRTIFENDESSARPAGTMSVAKFVVWDHGCRTGRSSTGKVFDSLKVKLKDGVKGLPASMDDYEITLEPVEGVECRELEV